MQQTIVTPYLRSTPLHDQRRDLVAYASDSLTLRVTVVESDNPNAQLLTITGGVGGPAAQLIIWGGYPPTSGRWDWSYGYGWGWGCDYGRGPPADGTILWSGTGTPQTGLGSFDFFLPANTFINFPRRCYWAVQLGWYGQKSDLLFSGVLQIRGGQFGALQVPEAIEPLLTDDSIPVLEDDTDPVFA
jgi:hypothetical protein